MAQGVGNKHIYAKPERIKDLKEEYNWLGTWVTQIDPEDPGHLIVYAIPPKKKSRKKKDEEDEKQARNKRGNGYSRHKEVDAGA